MFVLCEHVFYFEMSMMLLVALMVIGPHFYRFTCIAPQAKPIAASRYSLPSLLTSLSLYMYIYIRHVLFRSTQVTMVGFSRKGHDVILAFAAH